MQREKSQRVALFIHQTVSNAYLHSRNSVNLMRVISRFFYINHAHIYFGQLTQMHKKNNTQLQQNSHMFAHIIDSRQERERLEQKTVNQKGKKQRKETEGIQKLFLHKNMQMGYQSFQKGYDEQIVRLELDSVATSNKTREMFLHLKQGGTTYAKDFLPGITQSIFPHSFDSLRDTHKNRWDTLI